MSRDLREIIRLENAYNLLRDFVLENGSRVGLNRVRGGVRRVKKIMNSFLHDSESTFLRYTECRKNFYIFL